MSQRGIRKRALALAAVGAIVLFIAGCDCQQQVETLQGQNETLALRVEELESLLQRSEASARAAIARAEMQPPATAARPTAPTAPARPRTAQTPRSASTAQPQASAGRTVYTVVEGDNLWNIARRQLGRGIRYKEILDLNPSVSTNEPLAIGTRLILPAR